MRRVPRIVLLVAAATVAAIVLVVVGAFWALESQRVRKALIDQLDRRARATYGVAVTVEDFDLRPLRGALSVQHLSLATPGSARFLEIERLTLRWRPRALLRLEPRLSDLVLDSPRLDIAVLPELSPRTESTEGRQVPSVPLTVERFRLRSGVVENVAVEGLFGASRVTSIEATGSFLANRFEAELQNAAARLDLDPATRIAPLELRASGRVQGGLDGSWRLESLTLEGPPLELSARGSALAGGENATVELDLAADLAALLDPSQAPASDARAKESSRIHGRAEIDLAARAATFSLTAPDQPALLIEPWLAPETAKPLRLAETFISLDASGRAAIDGTSQVDLRLDLRRGRQLLARLAATPSTAPDLAGPVVSPLELTLFPEAPGSRSVTAILRASSLAALADPAALSFAKGRFRLHEPRVSDLVERLERLWPGLPVPATLPTGLLAGSLEASGDFSGRVDDPALTADLLWRPAGPTSSRLEVEVAGRPLAKSGRIASRGEKLELGLLAPGVEGSFDFSAEVERRGQRTTGTLQLAGRGLAAASDGPRLDRLGVEAHLADNELSWEASGETAGIRGIAAFEASGDLPLSRLPIDSAGVRVRLAIEPEALAVPLDAVTLEAKLSQGILDFRIPPTALAEGTAELEARLPLAALARVGALAPLMESVPFTQADGPLELHWRLEPVDWTSLAQVQLPETAPELLRAGARGALELDPEHPTRAAGYLEITELRARSGDLELTASAPLRVDIGSAEVRFADWRIDSDFGPLALEGEIELDPEWTWSQVLAAATREVALRASATLGASRLASVLGRADAETSGSLVSSLELTGSVENLEGRLLLSSSDLRFRSAGELPLDVLAGVEADLRFDPRDPWSLAGTAELPYLTATVDERRSELRGPLRIEVGGGSARLLPFELLSEGQSFALEGQIALDERGEEPEDLRITASLEGLGTVDSTLLNPWLGGGVARGALDLELGLEVVAESSPEALARKLQGSLRIGGPKMAVFFPAPYATRMSAPDVELLFTDGLLTVRSGNLVLNEGTVRFGGTAGPGDALDLWVRFSDVRYRLDHGLLARLAGDLEIERREGTPTIAGRVELERGALTRRMDLDLDLLGELLAPVDLTTTQDDPTDRIALDLELSTRDGVRIKNNIADLVARWQPIAVTGTLAAPVLEGRIEVDPGGLLHVYGQTVRLDRGVLDYPGLPGAEPSLELETTSSLQDPTIGRLAGNDLLISDSQDTTTGEPGVPGLAGALDSVSTGLATFWGEQIAARLSESLGGTNISIRPVLIFGEADPGARLTVSRDVSPTIALAASLDLRDAERQTYLLDVHELRRLRLFNGQAFTNVLEDTDPLTGRRLRTRGATARQILDFGGGRKSEMDVRLRLRSLRFNRPPGVSKRGFKRALALSKGDEIGDDELFAIEIEATEYLRRRGYPDARVETTTRPSGSKGRGLALDLEVEPGPRVELVFAGDKPPRALRDSITGLYRADFYEPTALQELKSQAIRVFRSRGFLDPRVQLTVTALERDNKGYERRVTIHTEAGVRVETLPPLFEGVDEEQAAFLRARFTSPVQRMELAVGLPEADRRLLEALRTLGYTDPEIVTRFSNRERPEITIQLAPGPRRRIAELTVTGVDPEIAAELKRLTALGPGDPARSDRLALAALAIEDELRRRGFPAARVRVELASVDPERPLDLGIILEVSAGPLTRLADVQFEGLRTTKEHWAARAADLEEGAIFRRDEVARARADLFATGLFSVVGADWTEPAPGERQVVFEVEERSRFQLAYGLRWDSEEGSSAVIDFTDRNLSGRGVTFGLRGLSSSGDRSVRGLVGIPRPFGAPGIIELFTRAREEIEDGFISETLETSLQYSLPIGDYSTARVYARYRDVQLSEDEPDPFLPLDERIRSPFLGLQYIYDSRRGAALPESGLFASADLSGADEFLGGDFRFVRFFGQVNLYRTSLRLFGRPLTWAQSFRLGLAESFGGQELDRRQRFFAGGEYSVRGYETESLGPQEALGVFERALGGRELLVINQEVRLPLFDSLSAVAFFDLGSVRGSSVDLGSPGLEVDNPAGLFKSIGLGLRAATPIGLLRLDLARPLDRRDFDPGFKLYVGFGNVF